MRSLWRDINTVSCLLFATLTIAYIVMYDPFPFTHAIDASLRIAIELLLLVILLLIWMFNSQPGLMPTSFILLPLILTWLYFSNSTDAPGLVTKFAFLILGAKVLSRRPLLAQFVIRAWILLWALISIQALLAAVGQYTGILTALSFPVWEELSDSSDRHFNPLFGFSMNRGYFGFNLVRVSGYLMEPQLLGLYSGLNILGAPYFLSKNHAKRFKILSLMAGLASGSVSFFLFFFSLGIFKSFGKHFREKIRGKKIYLILLMSVGGLVSSLFLFWLGAADESTSLSDRVWRLSIGVEALTHGNVHSWLFGDLNYMETIGVDSAIASGFLTVLVQRGLIPLVILIYLIYKYSKRDYLLMGYLFYMGMMVEYFWWPAFVVYLVIFYCLLTQTQKTLQPQTS